LTQRNVCINMEQARSIIPASHFLSGQAPG
jgi:hypothetical protein